MNEYLGEDSEGGEIPEEEEAPPGEEAREVEERREERRKEVEEELEEFNAIEERIYVVPLHGSRRGRGYRRTKRAINVLRNFVSKHMKSDDVTIMSEVNEKVWEDGIRSPPRRIRVRALKNEENQVRVYLH
jgi:large subunit ribosomal protein L31e